MNTPGRFLLLFGLTALFSITSPLPSHAHSDTVHGVRLGPVHIELRSSGHRLPTFVHHGVHYVLGQRGLNYSIYIKNITGQRLEVVTAVDGRDVITGEKANHFRRRGYILSPYRYVNITGFRTSQHSVAAFRFSTPSNSYAAKRGGAWFRIGTIQVAVFHEKRHIAYIPQRIPRHPIIHPTHRHNRGTGQLDKKLKGMAKPPHPSQTQENSPALRRRRHHHYIPRPTPKLGTAFGGSHYAPAQFTTFARASSHPTYQLSLRYNSCAGFRALRIYAPSCSPHWTTPTYRKRNPLQQKPQFTPPPQ